MALLSYSGFRFALNLSIIVSAVSFPFFIIMPAYAFLAYKFTLLASAISFAVSLYYATKGKWKLDKQALSLIVMTNDAQYLLSCSLFLLVGFMNLLVLGPLVIYATYSLSATAPAVLKPMAPGIYNMLVPRIKWLNDKVNRALLFAALMEVMLGMFLLLNLITGQSSLLIVMMFWNFLSLRYQTSGATKFVFGQVRMQLDAVFYHRFCPRPIGFIWGKILGFVRSRAGQC
eukprot:NODE_1695_length_787_cov_296.390244_g1317_i0.p1 GENE.NODE_1695_length_787_cov_296.390244_g1317_i0~~NODE_1695_length_787_cov_296.390244_g1317_i0.p1  ORF type:complete len:247 (+),score=72.68 NODE_1695_length_787_cov_296.390244_g1317_i0:54-743(+)